MESQTNKVSKYLSFILRHKPDYIGLQLDEFGWANIDELIFKSEKAGTKINLETIEMVVAKSDKQRFSISKDGKSIRANQGHSLAVKLGFQSLQPPDSLFHGTTVKNLERINSEGIRRMQRHHVHLTESSETAINVGKRYGKPVLLTIDSKSMFKDGFEFFKSENNVWLVDSVPVHYISKSELF